MPEGISTPIRLFADDTVIYHQINSAADHTILQKDLHKLARWEAEYSMEFHPEKCNVLSVTRSRSQSIFNYTLHGTNLKSTESTKYLGVTLTKDLTWGKHVDIIRAKANQQLAFVRRNIRTRSSSTKEKLFHTLVRQHLEYAATVWEPHFSKQKHSLEMIQRTAARWVTNRHHLHDPHVKQICTPSQHTSAGLTILNVPSSPKQLLLGMPSLKVWSLAPHWMHSRRHCHWGDRYHASVFEHTNLSCF